MGWASSYGLHVPRFASARSMRAIYWQASKRCCRPDGGATRHWKHGEFNEITAVIFSQLYGSFSVERDLDPAAIANVLGVSTSTNLPSGRSFNIVFISTLGRLIHEGFVHSYGHLHKERCVLTTKAMAVMNVVPPKLKQPFAAELTEATKNGSSDANKKKMAELMGSFFGSFTGSIWKSMGG